MKIVTLTLSCAFDIHCTADKLTVNHENLASIVSCDAGGKGINISRALTKFGVENTAGAVLGDENGDSFERALKNEGITLYPIWDKGRIRENNAQAICFTIVRTVSKLIIFPPISR